jgi:hypothetical protein
MTRSLRSTPSLRRLAASAWPIVLALITLVLAACNQNGGGLGY